MYKEINLNDPRILSSSEACFLWGIHDSSLRKRIHEFPEGTIRRFGTTWIVTTEGMKEVFGEKKSSFSKEELDSILKEMQQELKNVENKLSEKQLVKHGVEYLTKKGYHPSFSQSVIKVVKNQMSSELFYKIHQIER